MYLIAIFIICLIFVFIYTKQQDNQNDYPKYKKEKNKTTQIIEKEYLVENGNQKEFKKIHNTEYSITDIYLKPFNNSYKVLLLSNDKPIGDVPQQYVSEISSLRLITGQILVESDLDDNGEQIFKGTIMFKRSI